MSLVGYEYQKSQDTYTIDQYIACQSDDSACYNNLSFNEYVKEFNIEFNCYNVVSDYLHELRNEYCVKVTLSDKEMMKYKYRPKLLCYDIYGNGELAFIILLINDMINVKDFTKKELLMPMKTTMSDIVKYIYNSNKEALLKYNNAT